MAWLGLLTASLFLLFLVTAVFVLVVTVATQLRWRIPFVPTPMPIVETMLALASLRPEDRVVDLGAGDGRLLHAAVRQEPGIVGVGYELALGVYLLARVRRWLAHAPITLYRRDLFQADLRQADVVFLYLLPHLLERLMPKFSAELRPGTRIVSHAFALPGLTPASMHSVPLRFGGATFVYLYVWQG